jgi:hypothetical protein
MHVTKFSFQVNTIEPPDPHMQGVFWNLWGGKEGGDGFINLVLCALLVLIAGAFCAYRAQPALRGLRLRPPILTY